jgi:hypothetical protein
MTITSNTTSITWAGNGATQEFYYNFLIPSPGQCSLVYTAGGVTTVVAPGLFSIAGTGQPGGGSLVYPLTGSPIPAGTTLTLTRVVPLQQAYHPAVNGPIYNPDLESALDTLELQIQQVNAGLGFLEIDGTDINALSFSGAVSLSLSGTTLDVVVNTTPGPVGPTGAAGDVGATPTISVAAVSLASGSQPTVTLSGTDLDPEITFGLVTGPAGENGTNGAPGAVGATGPQGPQGVPGVGSSIIIENNGTAFSTAATAINFEGAGGTITMAGETVTVDLTGGGGGGGGTALTFSGSPVNLSAWTAGGTLNCYKSDQQFTFLSGQKISVTGSFNGQSSYANQQGVFLSKDGVNFYCLMYQESGNVIAYYNNNRGNFFNVPLFTSEFSLELLVYAVAAGGNNYVTGNFEGVGAFINTGLSDNNLDMTSGEWNVYFSVDNLSQILSGNLAID